MNSLSPAAFALSGGFGSEVQRLVDDPQQGSCRMRVDVDCAQGRAAQLAIGVPGENSWRGAVEVISGSSRGLTAKGDQMWSPRTVGLGGRSRLGDSFGIDMAAGNFGYDLGNRSFADLVIRVEDAKTGRSIVEVVHGSRGGLTTQSALGSR